MPRSQSIADGKSLDDPVLICLFASRSEQELAINIKKATSPEETAPKRKHVRSCIVYTWDHKSGQSFWTGLKVCVFPSHFLPSGRLRVQTSFCWQPRGWCFRREDNTEYRDDDTEPISLGRRTRRRRWPCVHAPSGALSHGAGISGPQVEGTGHVELLAVPGHLAEHTCLVFFMVLIVFLQTAYPRRRGSNL